MYRITILLCSLLLVASIAFAAFDSTKPAPAPTIDNSWLNIPWVDNEVSDELTASRMTMTVRNETGSTIPINRAVYVCGFNNVPLVCLADNTNIATDDPIGITTADIGNETNGTVVEQGDLAGVDMAAYSVGDILYLSTSGNYTTTPPTTGTVVMVGVVAVAENSGEMEVVFRNHTAVDDNPVNGVTSRASSSNWAFDHANNTNAHHTPTVNTDILADLLCTNDQVASWNGSAWACADQAGNVTAADVSIVDSGNLYTATETEAALAEAMTAINNLNSEVTVSDAKLDFGAKGDGVIHAGFNIYGDDCSISAASTTLTCASTILTPKYIGLTIIVYGAGTAGADLETTIDSYTSTTSVELTDAASTTTSSGDVKIGHGSGCHMTSGSSTITCTEPVFTSTVVDSGKDIAIEGAGAAGANLVSTISTVTSSTVAVLADNASTSVRYSWMKFGSDDTTAIQNAIAWAADNQGKIYFSEGIYMYNDEAVLDDTGLIEGSGSYNTLFAPLPGYSGGWFLTINDTWGQATPNEFDGADGGMGVTSEGISPLEYKQGPVLTNFSVMGTRQLDPSGTNGIRTYNRVDRTIWLDVSAFYMRGTGISLGTQGGTAYGGPGNLGLVRESQFFRNIVRGCGEYGTSNAFELGSQERDATTVSWFEPSNILSFYTLQLIYNYGVSGIFSDNADMMPTRFVNFYDLKLHGFLDYDYFQREQVSPDLFIMEGSMDLIKFITADANGSGVGGSNFIIKAGPVNGGIPENITINHTAYQFIGDDIVIEAAKDVRIEGSSMEYGSLGDVISMSSSADFSGKLIVDMLDYEGATYSIDSSWYPLVDARSGALTGYYDEYNLTYDFSTSEDIELFSATPGTLSISGGELKANFEGDNASNTIQITRYSANGGILSFSHHEQEQAPFGDIAEVGYQINSGDTVAIPESTTPATVSGIVYPAGEVTFKFYVSAVSSGYSIIDQYLDDINFVENADGAVIAAGDSRIIVQDSGVGVATINLDGEDTVKFGSNDYYANSHFDSLSNLANGFNMITANVNSTGTNFFRFMKARGSLNSPSATQDGDFLGLFYFGGYNGSEWDTRGFMSGNAVGNWNTSSEAFEINLYTKAVGESAGSTIRMTIQDDGEIEISDLAGSYSGGSAFVCVDNNGVLFSSESACP